MACSPCRCHGFHSLSRGFFELWLMSDVSACVIAGWYVAVGFLWDYFFCYIRRLFNDCNVVAKGRIWFVNFPDNVAFCVFYVRAQWLDVLLDGTNHLAAACNGLVAYSLLDRDWLRSKSSGNKEGTAGSDNKLRDTYSKGKAIAKTARPKKKSNFTPLRLQASIVLAQLRLDML
eukprot:CAMPEP_0115582552 /NCGR_PEP_ID=MMETSP0272-20121206/5720_1 /TAXON_ID=71861 /ORGANISM="Scrippsiella trochoidea, Strain CCMP3099" /LENGTH=173 /DNA_ID=CAMNT_0003017545 /DNA_START=136 /DNA_END=655 /DNA_ORIENTATION=-